MIDYKKIEALLALCPAFPWDPHEEYPEDKIDKMEELLGYLVGTEEPPLLELLELAQLVEPKLQSFDVKEGVIDLKLQAPVIAQVLASAFMEELTKCENYIEIGMTDTTNGQPITVTIQKHDQKTPHQIRQELETQIKSMDVRIHQLEEEKALWGKKS